MPGPRTRSAATRAAYDSRTQSQPPTPTAPTSDQPIDGETRWVDTGFGFAERQIYDADTGRWIGLGDTANIDRPSDGGGAGRTQFASEQALDVAQAKRLEEQTAIDRARIAADREANLRSEM